MRRDLFLITAVVCLAIILVAGSLTWNEAQTAVEDWELDKQGKAYSRAFAHYIMGMLYENEYSPEEAIGEYLEALEHDSTSLTIHKRLALVYIQNKDYSLAEKELNLVKSLNPQDIDTYLILGALYAYYLSDREAAIDQYNQTLEVDPHNLNALINLADLYVFEEDLEKAVSVYERIIKEKVEDSQVYLNLGMIYMDMEKYSQAEAAFKKAIENDPQFIKAYLSLGFLYEVQEKYPQAIEEYRKALDNDPSNVDVYRQLGQIYFKQGDTEGAIKHYKEILAQFSSNVEVYIDLAWLYLHEKNPDAAIELLNTALADKENWRIKLDIAEILKTKKNPFKTQEAHVYLLLGVSYTDKDDYPQAIEYFKKALDAEPENYLAHFYLGAAHDKSNRRQEAYTALKQALELEPDNPEVLNYLGYLYAEDGINLDEAEEMIRRALETDPENGAYIDSLGWVYYKKGMVDKAQKHIENAAELLEDHEIRDHLGDIYYKKGFFLKAKEEWLKSLELEVGQEEVEEKLKKLESLLPRENP